MSTGVNDGGASGRKARCCWCGKGFVRIDNSYWCVTPECRVLQAEHAIYVYDSANDRNIFLYVPLPKQVVLDSCNARNMLGGGAAGSTKSHSARWGMYRRCLSVENYEALLLRRTWPELEKHHFRLMAREAETFRNYGMNVTFSPTNREMVFHDTGSVIEGGHMENRDDVDKYLSRERDEIVADEGSTFDPKALLELSTRARSTKPQVHAIGSRGRFRVYTNPGGPASGMLRDFFIDHEPNWDDYAPELKEMYDPSEWVYIPGNLEDNPYLPESYERDLAVLQPWRFQQLRHNDWDIISGQFFTEFSGNTHVADLGDPGSNVEWFRSIDWGYVEPGWVGWWACLPDGVYYIRRELKYSHATIPEVCEKILEIDEELGIERVRYTVADPAMWQPAGTTGEAMNETFARHGVPLIKGHNDRVNGWQRVRELLKLREDGRPSIIIHSSCRYLIRTMSEAVSSRSNPEDVDTTIDDHPLDGVRYGAMSRPSPTSRRSPGASSRTFAGQKRLARKLRQMAKVR